jgi:hypothetical protein
MTAFDEAFFDEIKNLGGIVAQTHYAMHSRTMCPVCESNNRGALFHVMLNISHDRIPLGERSGAFTCSKDCTRTFVIEGMLKFG